MTTTTSIGSRQDRELLCELLQLFYDKGWCTGTGGGISARVRGGYLMAPSGVAKERVRPDDLFALGEDFQVAASPAAELHLSECAPLFESIYRTQEAGAVIHTHSVSLVAAMALRSDARRLGWQSLEMVKGIRGATYPERHEVPVIPNTPRECDLTASLQDALAALPRHAHAVFVEHHGAYVWGADVMSAKRHAEVYEWLCQYTVTMASTHGSN